MHEVESQRTQRRVLRSEYCIVGMPHNTAMHVGNLFGVLAYADDVTLTVPSAAAMRRLLQNAARGV